ncbi:MAG: hypothetical protein PHP67_04340 [Sphaerochaeta sp.]|nr:hypothetical protein [Sphaerochaeta sp.]MDD4647429.1 hypothetical protein [Sphaerochaeta sp.]
MIKHILKRLALLIPTIFGVITLVFLMIALAPGDPARIMLGERANAEQVAQLRTELGLDKPLIQQYGLYLGRIARFDVMYLGRIVEIADKNELVGNHVHPYTQALFNAFPATDPRARETKKRIVMGDVPSPNNPPEGCHFHPRCPYAVEKCRREYPPLKEVSPGHSAACWVVQNDTK